jgi:hypothetical protein
LSTAEAAAAPIASAATSAEREPDPPEDGVAGEAEDGDIGADRAAADAVEPLFGKALSPPASEDAADPEGFGFGNWLDIARSPL